MSCEREVSVWSMEMSAPQESDPKKNFRKRDAIKQERVVTGLSWQLPLGRARFNGSS